MAANKTVRNTSPEVKVGTKHKAVPTNVPVTVPLPEEDIGQAILFPRRWQLPSYHIIIPLGKLPTLRKRELGRWYAVYLYNR